MTGLTVAGASRRAEASRLTVSAFLVGIAAAAVTVGLIHIGSLKAIAGLIMIAGLLWFGTTRKPQLALALFMLYLGLLDGYLKLATGSNYVTFVRDVLLYAFTIGLLIRAAVTRAPMVAPPLAGWVIAFTLLVLIQMLNPNDGSLMHSLAGLRQNLEFVPLFWLTFAFVRTRRALRNLVFLLIFVAMANGVVTIVQAHESPAQLASWGSGYAARVDGTGAFAQGGRTFYSTTTGQQFVRPFGLMSDSGTGGLVCAFALACIIAVATMPGRRKYALPAIAAAIIAVEGMIDSQGRSVIIAAVVIAAAYGAMTGNSRFRGRGMTLLVTLGIAGLVYFGATKYLANSGSRDSSLSASQLLQTTSQSRGLALRAIPTNLADYPLGSGLGSGGPAAGQSGAPAAVQSVNAESEISLATLETGIPGMLVIVGFTAFLLYVGVRRCPREPDSETRVLLAALIAPLAALLVLYWVSPLTATTPTGPYLFGIGGIISYWLIERPRTLRLGQAESDGEARPRRLRLGQAESDSPAGARTLRRGQVEPTGAVGVMLRSGQVSFGVAEARAQRPGDVESVDARIGPRGHVVTDGAPAPSAGPRISVVIATRDRPELLTRVLTQLLDQLRDEDEIVVVDDSTSPTDLRGWLGDRVLYMKSGGRGPAAARNLGWRATTGEVVAFTDDDVQVDPNWLAAVRMEFAARPDLVGIEGRTVSRPFDPLYEYSVYADRAWNGLTCNVAYRRTALERLAGFDEAFRFAHCEDVDLFNRAKHLGSVEFASNVVVDHEPRPIIPATFARRGGWLASERRLYVKHPELKPYPLPPGICAVVAYLRWPIESLFTKADPSPLRNKGRLQRTALLTALWWWNVAKAVPSLAVSRP